MKEDTMFMSTLGRSLCIGWCILLSGIVVIAAPPRALSDSQLDGIFAAGLDVQVSMDMDIAASQPDSVLIQGGAGAAQQLLNQGLTLTRTGIGDRNSSSFDPSGAYMPNLQNLVVNNLNITQNALQNANTLMNIFAMQGDVAVGVNLNVVVNPVNTYIAPVQTNMNWGMLNLGANLSSLSPVPGLQ